LKIVYLLYILVPDLLLNISPA